MIKSSGFPACDLVTGSAVHAKPAFMGIVFGMAVTASGREGQEISEHARFGMAILAVKTDMLAFQLEGRAAVIELFTDGFQTIMTGHAFRAISLGV